MAEIYISAKARSVSAAGEAVARISKVFRNAAHAVSYRRMMSEGVEGD